MATWRVPLRKRRSAGPRRSSAGILPQDPTPAVPAVYGCTEDDPELHFLGWANEVDPDELFASGKAWGISVRRVAATTDSP